MAGGLPAPAPPLEEQRGDGRECWEQAGARRGSPDAE